MHRDKNIMVRVNQTEKNHMENFAKDNNRTVSQLLRDSVQIVMRNPTLLDPTGETAKLLIDVDRAGKISAGYNEAIVKTFKEIISKIDVIDKKVDESLEVQGVPKKKIEKIGKERSLGSLINE